MRGWGVTEKIEVLSIEHLDDLCCVYWTFVSINSLVTSMLT